MSLLPNLRVTVPVTFFPAGVLIPLVLAPDKHLDHVAAVELAVQVGIADPGVLQLIDPHLPIDEVDQAVIGQVVLGRIIGQSLIAIACRSRSAASKTPLPS